MLRQPRPDQSSKLQAKYRERPLQIMEVLPGDTYKVAELATDGREVYATTAHISQLKSWKILREVEEEDLTEAEGDVRHEVEEEDLPRYQTTVPRPSRTRMPPARLADYKLNY